MSRYGYFVDTIPDLATQMGISSLEYLHVAVEQSRYYGYDNIANWFEYWKERFEECVEEEWDEGEWELEDANLA